MNVRRSFDDLVGEREQRRRQVEPERLGGLEIDHQLELDRLHHRQVGRLRTSKCPSENILNPLNRL